MVEAEFGGFQLLGGAGIVGGHFEELGVGLADAVEHDDLAHLVEQAADVEFVGGEHAHVLADGGHAFCDLGGEGGALPDVGHVEAGFLFDVLELGDDGYLGDDVLEDLEAQDGAGVFGGHALGGQAVVGAVGNAQDLGGQGGVLG